MSHSNLTRDGEVEIDLWSQDAIEAAVDVYMTAATVGQIAELVGRSPNAVIWKLWSVSGARPDLKEQMLVRGDAAPLREADVRIRKTAFRWVLVHLRSAAAQWSAEGREVTLKELSSQAENTLLLWSGRPSDAAEIEQSVAHWLVDHPSLWLANGEEGNRDDSSAGSNAAPR